MKICKFCGAPLEEGKSHCQKCGAPAEQAAYCVPDNAASGSAGAAQSMPQQPHRKGKWIFFAGAAVLLVLIATASVFAYRIISQKMASGNPMIGGINSVGASAEDARSSEAALSAEGAPSGENALSSEVTSSTEDVAAPEEASNLPLLAADLTWSVEPTYSFDDVAPVYAMQFSDIGIGGQSLNVANGTENLFEDTFAGAEMSFPEYSCLDAYYSVTENGKTKLFYMPTMSDSGDFYLPSDQRWYVHDTSGIEFYQTLPGLDYAATYDKLAALTPPWNVIHDCERGGAHCVVGWDVATQQAYVYSSGEGAWDIQPVALSGLHKSYAAAQFDFSCAGATPQQLVSGSWDESIDFTAHTDNADKFALVSADGTLLTDFIYDRMSSCSEGITAACLGGKWGYLDETGDPITAFEFDAPWLYNTGYMYSPEGTTRPDPPYYAAFPCTCDTIVVQKDGAYGLLYRDGTLLIDYGQYSRYAPAYDDKLWAYDDASKKWGLLDLAAIKAAINPDGASQAAALPAVATAQEETSQGTSAPTAAQADSASAETVASGECGAEGGNVTWTLDSNGLLLIEGSGAMQDYDFLNMASFDQAITSFVAPYLKQIKAIQIAPGVTTIGVCAFIYCDQLVSVSIPDTVSKIEYSAFGGCSSLTDVKIPSGVTSIPQLVFSGCTGLKSITIPVSVTTLSLNALENCTSLKEINYEGSETDWANITTFEGINPMPDIPIHYNSK